jgi:hypothetical protein
MAFRLAFSTVLCALFAAGVPAVAGACSSSDPTPVWMTGLEHGVSSTISGQPFVYGSNGGTPDSGPDDGDPLKGSDPTRVRTGKYSLRLHPTGSNLVYRDRVVDWKPVLVERFYMRLDSLPTANVRELAGIYSTSHTAKNSSGTSPRYAAHLGYQAGSGKLSMELNTGTPGTLANGGLKEGPAITPADWHLIEIRYDVASGAPYGATTTHRVEWMVDGAPQPAVTLPNAPSTYINEVIWGNTFTGDAFAANYDDLMLSQTPGDYSEVPGQDKMGGGRILRLGPNDSNGPHSGVQNFKDVENGVAYDINSRPGPLPGTTDPSYNALTDVPFAVPGRHLAQITGASTSYVQIGFENTAEQCIRAVSGWVAWDPQNTKYDNNGTTKVVDGSTETTVFSGKMSYTSTQPWIRTAIVARPNDPSGWTADRVNGLVARVGYSTDTSPRPWWDALMLEYEVSP